LKKKDCNDPKRMPDLPADDSGLYLPFYYHSIASLWMYFSVDLDILYPFLEETGLKPGVFDGKGLVNINFMNYTAHNGNSLAATSELELNIIAFPAAKADRVPSISAACYLSGQDQTKTLGNYRVHVPCDNPFAVEAGKSLFGENKFVANFAYKVPSINLPPQKVWNFTISDDNKKVILGVTADFHKLVPGIANPTPIINYSMKNSRLVGSRRNYLFAAQNYMPLSKSDQKKIVVNIGNSPKENMAADLAAILGKDSKGNAKTPAIAIQVIQSLPVIIESRSFYAGFS